MKKSGASNHKQTKLNSYFLPNGKKGEASSKPKPKPKADPKPAPVWYIDDDDDDFDTTDWLNLSDGE
jgi:hypothetical protein